MRSGSEAWDITVEVMNQCAGSCTGCTLSADERRHGQAVIGQDEFEAAMAVLARHGKEHGMVFRPVLVFGDMPLMPHATLVGYLGACARHGMPIGVTVTLASEGLDDHYARSLELILGHGDVVLDMTIDPFRLETRKGYAARVRDALKSNPHNHVQVLLSEVMLNRLGPEALASRLEASIGNHPVSLAFTPTQVNLMRRQYQFDVNEAIRYARTFYGSRPWHEAHYRREMTRLTCAQGDYATFAAQAFHVGRGLDVYATIFTPFGDLVLDGRNGIGPIGNLRDGGLDGLALAPRLLALQARNAGWLRHDIYGCGTCDHLEVCGFHGVGLANKLFAGHDSKHGTCYGPRGFIEEGAELV